ncbi:MAG: hypothetical protein E6G92_07890 [Alphaproteobacteria bacterium]|nr:MAG: hypothetical protein E6G92_07890 [Alphaproteobacteria bacterium]
MINVVIALLMVSPPSESTPIRIDIREMSGLRHSDEVVRGTCDERPVSLTITKAYRDAPGRLVLRLGRRTQEIPVSFLNGQLVQESLQSVGLACDGRRLQVRAIVARADSGGDIVLDVQQATLDIATGSLVIGALRTLSPAETRSELR